LLKSKLEIASYEKSIYTYKSIPSVLDIIGYRFNIWAAYLDPGNICCLAIYVDGAFDRLS